MVRGLILDFDGLIVDSESVWLHVLRRLYATYGATLSDQRWLLGVGRGLDAFDPFQELADLVRGDRLALEAEGEALFRARMRRCRPLPGVVRLVRRAATRGLVLAVASSSRRASVVPYLVGFGIDTYLAGVFTAEDVERVKPAPDLYLRALASLDLHADEAIAFEDSVNGLRAARAARVRCVVVPNPVTRHDDFTGSHLTVRSMRDVDLDALVTA